jgi:hypothetical protein
MNLRRFAAGCGVGATVVGTALACSADPSNPPVVEKTSTTTETATVTETETKIDYPDFPSALIPTVTETVIVPPVS